jgi:DNA-binding transcriptional ArsR family regulator
MKEFSNEAYYMFFSTLANGIRLAIIDNLKEGPKTISEISTALNQEPDIISKNLKSLERCVLVISESSKNEQIYSLNKEIIEPLSHVLEIQTTKYCPGLRECIPKEKHREFMKKEAAKDMFIEN